MSSLALSSPVFAPFLFSEESFEFENLFPVGFELVTFLAIV